MKKLYICSLGLILLSFVYSLPENCTMNCENPYGKVIGVHSGVTAYSNCYYNCVSYEPNRIKIDNKEIYTGMKWQCVEYARRYLILKLGVTFGDIDCAYQIYDLKNVTSINSSESFEFSSYKNGGAVPPKKNDLLIFRKAYDSPYGHVAVITNVDLKNGFVEICEQNNFQHWKDYYSYSRRLRLETQNSKYFITDKEYLPHIKKDFHSYYYSAIGWKRANIN